MEIDREKGKIGIDIDDTIAEFMINFLEYSNKKNKTSFTLQDVTNYNLWEIAIHKSKEEGDKEINEFQESPFFENVGLVEGVLSALTKLNNIHKIYFITSRPEKIKEKTISFFNKHFPENEFEIIHSGEVCGGKLFKSEICKIFKISLIIEDNPNYALDCAKKGIKVILLDKPWNKNYEKHQNIIKVKNWGEILKELEINK